MNLGKIFKPSILSGLMMDRIRSKQEVHTRLSQEGIKPGGLTKGRLSKLDMNQYGSVLKLVDDLKKKGIDIKRLETPYLVDLKKMDISKVSVDWVEENCVEKKSLDLSPIMQYSAARYADNSALKWVGPFCIEVIDRPELNLKPVQEDAIREIRDMIISIYTDEKGNRRTVDELVNDLSINDSGMYERIMNVDQLQVVRLDGRVVGVASSRLIEVSPNLQAFYIAETMVRPEAQGQKLHILMNFEMAIKAQREMVMLKGFGGLFTMFFKGIPVVARTQSKIVTRDLMSRLSDCYIPYEGTTPPNELKIIIRKLAREQGCLTALDDRLIARGVYNGKIALEREGRIRLKDKKLDEFFKNNIGENDAIYPIGYASYWRLIKVAAETGLANFKKRFSF